MRIVIFILLQLAVYCGVIKGQQKSNMLFADFVKLSKAEHDVGG